MADVELLINGNAYSGWKSVDIQSDIDQLAGSFELAVSEAPDGGAATDLYDGASASLRLAGETVITGFIDDLEIEHSATEHTITVRGRDAAADLVDCSAMHTPGQWMNQGMLSIVQDLVKPFGIKVKATAGLGKPFEQWNIEPGESVFENIDKLARHRGVLIISDSAGGIVITQPGTEVVGTALRLGENILSGGLRRSCRQRFSEYSVVGDRQRDDFNEPTDIKPRGTAKDAYVKRHRPLVGIYEDTNATTQSLNDRAKWQASVNAGRAQRVNITVQGWKHADGLWRANKLVTVTDARLRLDNTTLLIAGVRYLLNDQGTRTELTLVPCDAFLVDKLPEELTL